MQFYVIHSDPCANAYALPDYAIKKVNVREGWQILSDIGHAAGVQWKGQNKEYNRYHPNTWKWWKYKEGPFDFCNYYKCCLIEYENRFEKKTIFHDKFIYFDECNLLSDIVENIKFTDEYKDTTYYMLDRKLQHMTTEEIKRLRDLL